MEGNSEVDTIETLQYIDGLNRTIETVKKRQHHINSYDIIHALEYDNQGRVEKQYEPQKFIGNGAFLTIDSGWDHTLNEYEESPLNRLESTTPPSWYPSTMEYGSNSTSDSVYIDGTDNIYGDDLLYKKTSIDGNGNKSIVFTDKKGRTILQRRTNSSGSDKNDTYSIYDDKDRLIMVIPPGADTSTIDLIYTYEYDAADNLIKKKVPDKDTILYKYNDRDLLSLQQDGNLNNEDKWYAYTYDDHGRETVSGFFTGQLPTEPFTAVEPTDTLTLNVYGTTAFEKDKIVTEKTRILETQDWLETEYEYDNCSRVTKTISNNQLLLGSKKDTTYTTYDGAGNVTQSTYSHRTLIDTILIVERNELDHIGRLDKHFITIDTFDEQELSSFEYNEEEHLITKKLGKTSSGYLQQLDYTYKPNNLLRKINDSSLSGGDIFFMQLNYDTVYPGTSPALRKNGDIINTIWKNISENERVYSYSYDYLDRLTAGDYLEKTSGGSSVNQDDYNTAYGYDERGNITSLNRKGMYGDPGDLQKSGIDSLSYSYYTDSNQLKNVAEDQSGEAGDEGYYKANSNDYVYDDNGNLVTDPQKNLTIKYNHLDLVDTIAFSEDRRLEFIYDAGGSLLRRLTYIQDTFKVEQRDYIGGMEYTNGSLESIYHAEGRAVHLGYHPDTLYVRDSVSGVHEYQAKVIISDAHVYEIDSTFFTFSVDSSVLILPEFEIDSSAEFLSKIDTFDGIGWQFEYVVADHLGNTRLVFSDLNDDESIDSSEILQRLHYYPFGLRRKGSWTFEQTSNISYQYNGIEYLDQFGLDVNLADFRALDPAVGRWWSVDPKAESLGGLSPYQAMGNNPILKVDPGGDFSFIPILNWCRNWSYNGRNF